MQKSLWKETVTLPEFKALNKDIKTDVLIIGGGIAGILCAYFLDKAGINYALVEKNRICQGVTGNTTAKITALHSLVYTNLIKNFGKETAQKYFIANDDAIKKYADLCADIDCDFERLSAYTYSISNKEVIEKEVEAINQISKNAHFREKLSLPFDVAGAVELENQAQFNPLKFIKEISRNLNIYENTTVCSIEDGYALCGKFKIKADKIIVATHFPFINKHGVYFLKLYQERSYVISLENAQNVKGMYVDEASGGLSFRNNGKHLILGGGGGRTGKNNGGWDAVLKFGEKHYPKSTITGKWATQDCITLDKIPYIGQYSQRTPNLYVATGFNKWGMTSSMVAATILCDAIQGIENDIADIFSPSRSILKSQLFINGVESMVNLLSPTTKRCSHLGCALKWNKQEHTWDCPCHGSRFHENGRVINNPAAKDI